MEEKTITLSLNVYDDDDNVIKTEEARTIDLKFGTVRALMELLNVEDIENTAQLLKTVYGAWKQVTGILSRVFPGMNDEDWENVKIGELMPLLITILKSSFVELMAIPTDPKNATGA